MPNRIDSFEPFIYDTPVNTGYFKGYISNFRITNRALYSGNFVPPSNNTLTTSTVGTSGANVATSLDPGSVIVLSFTDNDIVTKNTSSSANIGLTAYGFPTVNNIKTGLSYDQYVARRDETSSIRMQYFDRYDAGDVILIRELDTGFTATATVISADINNVTFNTPTGFPTNPRSGGMTIQNLGSFVKPIAQLGPFVDWRTASTPQERLIASRLRENQTTVKLFIDRNLGENISSNLGIFQSLSPQIDRSIPGDFRLLVTGINTTPVGNTEVFYTDDVDILSSFTRNTGNVTTISFAYQDAAPFAVNSNVRLIDTTTGYSVVTTVLVSTNSSVTANVFFANVGATVYIEKDYGLVYPKTLVKPTTRPTNSRELLYYLDLSPRLYGNKDNVFQAMLPDPGHNMRGNLAIESSNRILFPNAAPITRETALGRYWYSTIAPGFNAKPLYVYSTQISHQEPIKSYTDLVSDLDDAFGRELRRGQQIYTIPGTYLWTAPPGVTRVSVVAIGGGGGGSNNGEGGGGGGLGWGNVSVVPGNNYTVQVGGGGSGGVGSNFAAGDNGGASWFGSNTTIAGFGGAGGGRIVLTGNTVNTGGSFIGDGGGTGGNGGTWSGIGYRGGAGGGGAGGYGGNGGRGGDASSESSVVFYASSGQGGGGGGGYGAIASPSIYDYTGSSGGGGGGVGLFFQGNSGLAGTVTSTGNLSSITYEPVTYLTSGAVNITTVNDYYEGNDANINLPSWSPNTVFYMSEMGGLGPTTAHGYVPATWFYFFSNALPQHTQVRYSFYWHFVDSVDNETSLFDVDGVRYLQFTKVWNAAGASSITTNLCGANSANGGNFSWRTYNGYSYAPWGGNRGDGANGYFYVDTGWINHTTANITLAHYIGPDEGITNEASYISHVRLQTRSTTANIITGEFTMYRAAANDAWDASVYSLQPFTAPCTIEFNKLSGGPGDNGVGYSMIGWNADPTTNASYDTIDYAAYPYRNDAYSVHHNGAEVNLSGSFSTATKFYVVYDRDGFIRHYNGSRLLYTSPFYGLNNIVYFDSSLYSGNQVFGAFSNVRIARASWNGNAYVGSAYTGGTGGSGGTSGLNGQTFLEFVPRNGQPGGLYGGGGSGGGPIGTLFNYYVSGGSGGGGAVRIIYGTGVAYPFASNVSFTTGNAVISQANYRVLTSSINNKPRDLLYFAQRAPGFKGVSRRALQGPEMVGNGDFLADDKQGHSLRLRQSLGAIFALGLKKGNINDQWANFTLDQRVNLLQRAFQQVRGTASVNLLPTGRMEVARTQLIETGKLDTVFRLEFPKISMSEVIDLVNRLDARYFPSIERRFTVLKDVEDRRQTGRLELRQRGMSVTFNWQLALVEDRRAPPFMGKLELFKLPANALHGLQDISQRKKDPVTFWT